MPCFFVLSGALNIVMTRLSGEHVFATHRPGNFSGDMVLISGTGSLARGRVAEPGEFLEVTIDCLRSLIAKDAELSDIFMRAFIQRRLTLIAEGLGNVIILGSRYSANTLRLREFLTRNGHPHTYIDLDSDTAAQEMLDRFSLKIDEIPVVICGGKAMLRNPTTQQLAGCLGFAGTVHESRIRDVAIVGGGPAGLAAAVYAASEGLDTVHLVPSHFQLRKSVLSVAGNSLGIQNVNFSSPLERSDKSKALNSGAPLSSVLLRRPSVRRSPIPTRGDSIRSLLRHQYHLLSISVSVTRYSRSAGSVANCFSSGEKPPNAKSM
jgi:CRP-like cAMP-binding protein